MPCAAVIVASGLSRRMGFDKLAAPLAGVSVLRRTVDAFMAAPGIERVIVVCPAERFQALLSGDFPKQLIQIEGGDQRQQSVEAGLAAVGEDDQLVAVHDGARPLIGIEAIDLCIEEARKHGAAALARPVTETIKKADADGFSRGGVDREMLWFTETPQVFRTSVLRRAFAHVNETALAVTDEVSVVESIGIATKLIPSPRPNPKITVPADIELAEALLR